MLKEIISNIPAGILRKLVGQNISDAIVNYNIYNNNIEVDYASILINKFGTDIFKNKDILNALILFMPLKNVSSLAKKLGIKDDTEEDKRGALVAAITPSDSTSLTNLLMELGIDPSPYIQLEDNLSVETQETIEPQYRLHQYQKNLKDKAIQFLLSVEHSNRLLIHMPTGAGKTKTAMELLADYLRTRSVLGGFDKSILIIWLAHSKELCEQAYETFSNTWKLRGDYYIDTFKLYGDHKYTPDIVTTSRAVIFGSFQKFNSLISSNNPLQKQILSAILDKVRLVIIDEAHKSLATTYQTTITKLTESYAGVQLVGLTATPGRSADHSNFENNHLAYFFNSTRLGLIDDDGIEIKEPIKYLQSLGVLAEIERQELMTEVQIKLVEKQMRDLQTFGDEKLNEILNDLALHPGRNHLIIEKIRALYAEGDSILVFACNVEHCVILQTLLYSYGIESETILGVTDKKDRERSIKKFKDGSLKVLINYGVLTTGFDAPNLNSLIITRPTSSLVLYSQMVGRALRGPLNGGNKKNKLIDLQDNWVLGNENMMFNFYNEIWQ
jgi:DNA repair protein RadD